MEIKKLFDEYGIINEAMRVLPQEYKVQLLEALAELEDNSCHKNRDFPKTRLHKVSGYKTPIYRADIDKTSGWRLHVQYNKELNSITLKDILAGKKHDDVIKVIKAKKNRYDLS